MAAISRLGKAVASACMVALAAPAAAAGHGPVFGATTPTLGRGGWSIDQAYTVRLGDDGQRSEMVKTMISYGVTENLQVSASVPLAMRDGNLSAARMMSLMSSDREVEGLVGYRFHRRTVGIGGRLESTLYVGGTVPLESRRGAFVPNVPTVAAGASAELGIATGYASRAHYLWAGGGVQRFFERDGERLGTSRLVTAVYGYRPPALRTEAGKPDLRFFGEATFEDRRPTTAANWPNDAARTLFAGPTSLLLYKALGVEGGVLFPAYQSVATGRSSERVRVAVNVSYFFWLK